MKKLFIAFIFILITGNLYSNPVDSVLVKTIAKNYFEFLNPSRTNIEIKNIITIYYNGYPSYYIVNFIGNGYIAVSANNATIPILMYSYGGEYKETDFHNPAYLDWMENYSKEIDSVRINNIPNDSTIQEWDNIINKNFPNYKAEIIVDTLITTKWGQGCYYNKLCPSNNDCNCGHCNVGCVAVAMAQVMKYWMHPVHSTYKDYDWCNMPDILLSSSTNFNIEKNAIATLMHNCGVKANMNYCIFLGGGCQSFAWPTDARKALVNDFGYSDNANIDRRQYYSKKNWIKKLKTELDNKRPVIYFSLNGLFGGGHAFIIDGYNSDDKFHINWGWNGNDNEWYEIGDLTPGPFNFNLKHRAIFNLYPAWYINCNSVLQVSQIYEYISYLSHLYYNPVAGTIIAGGSETPLTIQSGQTVHYQAYNQINLNEGFTAEAGSNFTAEIVQCPLDCKYPPVYINTMSILSEYYNYDEVNNMIIDTLINSEITISPNPFTDFIEIKNNIIQIDKIEIINMHSKVVYEKNNIGNSIYLGFLENGIYLLKIYTSDNIYVKKIIKQ